MKMEITTNDMCESATITLRQTGYSEELVFNIPDLTTSLAALGKKLCCL